MRYFIAVYCVLSLSSSASAQLAKEISGSKLLTTSIRTGDTEVFIFDPVTADALNVTKAPSSEERYPIWMPDGKQVVFTSNREDEKTFNLYIANADGSQVIRSSSPSTRSTSPTPTPPRSCSSSPPAGSRPSRSVAFVASSSARPARAFC